MSPTRVTPATLSRAQVLRRNTTITEWRLWHALKTVRVSGSHFRRQVPIGTFIADFACHRTKLIIEADGGQHTDIDAVVHDETRAAWLVTQGYRVLRFQNPDIIHNLEGVIAAIKEAILESAAEKEQSQHSSPYRWQRPPLTLPGRYRDQRTNQSRCWTTFSAFPLWGGYRSDWWGSPAKPLKAFRSALYIRP